jgi:hypothetical protein
MDAMLPPRHDRNYRYQRQCADGGRGRFNAVILLAYLQLGESWRRPLLVAYGLAPEVAELLGDFRRQERFGDESILIGLRHCK